jgi:hypothetical protein
MGGDRPDPLARRASLRRVAPAFVAAAAAFLGVGFALSAFTQAASPPPEIPVLSPKLAHLLERAGDYDLVLLGDSRTFRGIDPTRLDVELERRGCPARSFNAGVSALHPIELIDFLERLAEGGAKPLPHLLIQDVQPVDASMTNLRSRRQMYFARVGNLPLAFRSIRASNLSPFGKFESGAKVSIATLYSHLGTGQLGHLLNPGISGREPDSGALFEQRGFVSLETEAARSAGPSAERRVAFLADQAGAEARLDELRSIDFSEPAPLPHGYEALLLEILGHARRAGDHVALYFMPRAREPLVARQARRLEQSWPTSHPEFPVLNFHDPERFPELYASDSWWDTGHLNQRGAELFSRSIAEPICAWLRATRG